MIDFSLVLPTRGNITGLTRMITSFLDKAKNKDCVEFVIAPDLDDPELNLIKESVKPYPVKVFETHPTDNFCRDYFNWLTWKSSGKSVWCMNDDVEMETQDWDEIVRDKIKDKRFYLVDILDSTHEEGGVSYPRFPLISRASIDVIGFTFYPQVRMYPADRIIYELYKNLDLIVPCHEVQLRHDWIPVSDKSKSLLMRFYDEDNRNGVYPINLLPEMNKLRDFDKRITQQTNKEKLNGN